MLLDVECAYISSHIPLPANHSNSLPELSQQIDSHVQYQKTLVYLHLIGKITPSKEMDMLVQNQQMLHDLQNSISEYSGYISRILDSSPLPYQKQYEQSSPQDSYLHSELPGPYL